MNKFPPTFLAEIRQRVSLVDEVRRVVPGLKKKGKTWQACCPFHNEKTPSFHVYAEQGTYHCFGCGAHGDVITFLKETRGGSFPEVVAHLAQRAGIKMPEQEKTDPAEAQRRQDGYSALTRAQELYQKRLTSIQPYLTERQLSTQTAATFGLGYAPESWDDIKLQLINDGFSEHVLQEAGLLSSSRNSKGTYDRFRNRLMFPIHDIQDRVVGFGGRIMGQGEPKYLNSPDTSFFNKSYLLFNLNRARHHLKSADPLILVEGYMDAISLWQAGIQTAVAPMGTSVTPEQLQTMWRYASCPVVCLDGDKAGQAAAERTARRAISVMRPGQDLRFARLPEGQDPDDFIRAHGADAFRKLLAEHTTSLEEVLWSIVKGTQDMTTGAGRAAIEAEINTLRQDMADYVIQRHLTSALRDRLYASRGKKPQTHVLQGKHNKVPALETTGLSRQLLLHACAQPWLVRHFDEELCSLDFPDATESHLLHMLIQAYTKNSLEDALEKQTLTAYIEAQGWQPQDEINFILSASREEQKEFFASTLRCVQTHLQQQAEERALYNQLANQPTGTTDALEKLYRKGLSLREKRQQA